MHGTEETHGARGAADVAASGSSNGTTHRVPGRVASRLADVAPTDTAVGAEVGRTAGSEAGSGMGPEVLVLLSRLVTERPDVISALHTLLGAMLGDAPGARGARNTRVDDATRAQPTTTDEAAHEVDGTRTLSQRGVIPEAADAAPAFVPRQAVVGLDASPAESAPFQASLGTLLETSSDTLLGTSLESSRETSPEASLKVAVETSVETSPETSLETSFPTSSPTSLVDERAASAAIAPSAAPTSPAEPADGSPCPTAPVESGSPDASRSEPAAGSEAAAAPTASPAARPSTRPPLTMSIATKRVPSADPGVRKLMDLFNPNCARGGLAHVEHLERDAPVTPPFHREADRARAVAALATAQAQRLRQVRRARDGSEPMPAPSGRLVAERVHDWTAAPDALARHESRELKVVERWYELVARAFDEIERWFAARPKPLLTNGERAELKERLTCAALAQKGVYSWLSRAHLGGAKALHACGVQQRAFDTIKSWARRENEGGFAMFIESGLVLDQAVTTDEQRRIDAALDRFEVSQAPDEPSRGETSRNEASGNETRHRDARDARPAPAATERFASVADAYEAARTAFGDLLVFTERAEESAERSPFKRPDEVYECLETMHGIARDHAAGDLAGRPLDEVFKQRGFVKKPCSKPTMKRHHRFYHASYDGREVDLSQHITLGSRNQNTCLSIHWWHDAERGQFVILHCGKHLPNTLT